MKKRSGKFLVFQDDLILTMITSHSFKGREGG